MKAPICAGHIAKTGSGTYGAFVGTDSNPNDEDNGLGPEASFEVTHHKTKADAKNAAEAMIKALGWNMDEPWFE